MRVWLLLVTVIGLVSFVLAYQTSEDYAYTSQKYEDYAKRENITLSSEKQVIQYLKWKYAISGRDGRPVLNDSSTIHVEFGLGLIQMELDEKRKVFITSMWSKLRWRDEYLTWNPAEYNGVSLVRIEADHLWIPDIMLYNTADPDGSKRNALMLVSADGFVQWIPHQLFQSSCKIDVTHFPFDGQTCTMWFGSWTHAQSEIDLHLAFEQGIDMSTFQSDYKESCEWDLVASRVNRKLLPENDTNPIAVIAFTLQLQRKVVFSSYILTLPCIFLAFLTLVVFCMPPDRPDRTGLAMNLFGSFLVLLLILVEAAPPTASSVPLIGVYYCFNMVIIMMAIFLSALVVNIQRGCEYRLPKYVRIIFLTIMAKVVFIYIDRKKIANIVTKDKRNHGNDNVKRSTVDGDCEVVHRLVNHRRSSTDEDRHTTTVSMAGGGSTNAGYDIKKSSVYNQFYNYKSAATSTQNGHANSTGNNLYVRLKNADSEQRTNVLETQVIDICNTLHDLRQELKRKEVATASAQAIIYEWKQLARVLDRLFLLIFLVAIIVSLITLFPRPPWWHKSDYGMFNK